MWTTRKAREDRKSHLAIGTEREYSVSNQDNYHSPCKHPCTHLIQVPPKDTAAHTGAMSPVAQGWGMSLSTKTMSSKIFSGLENLFMGKCPPYSHGLGHLVLGTRYKVQSCPWYKELASQC